MAQGARTSIKSHPNKSFMCAQQRMKSQEDNNQSETNFEFG
jgi:hypothetical protein